MPASLCREITLSLPLTHIGINEKYFTKWQISLQEEDSFILPSYAITDQFRILIFHLYFPWISERGHWPFPAWTTITNSIRSLGTLDLQRTSFETNCTSDSGFGLSVIKYVWLKYGVCLWNWFPCICRSVMILHFILISGAHHIW